MPRSLKKGPFVDDHLIKKVKNSIETKDRTVIKTCLGVQPLFRKW